MDRKKSHKQLNSSHKPVASYKDIVKQIASLKKDLVKIKSKKNLFITDRTPDQANKQNIHDGRQQLAKQAFTIEAQDQTQCNCVSNKKTRQGEAKLEWPNYRQRLRIEFAGIDSCKCKQTRLKVSIQLSKVKTLLDKLHQAGAEGDTIKLVVAELNTALLQIDTQFKHYEYSLHQKQSACQQATQELASVTARMLKLDSKRSTQREVAEVQSEEIEELKRHLCYYMQLMQDSKEEATKADAQLKDLELLCSELEASNRVLKEQVKKLTEADQAGKARLKEIEEVLEGRDRRINIMESELQLSRVDRENQREKRREAERHRELLQLQLKELETKDKLRQVSVANLEGENKSLTQQINEVRKQKEALAQSMLGVQLQRQQQNRCISELKATLTSKQEAISQQYRQLELLQKELLESQHKNKQLQNSNKYLALEIDHLSQQIDEQNRAMERYKNKLFRDKVVNSKNDSCEHQGDSIVSNKSGEGFNAKQRLKVQSSTKVKQRALEQIHELIQRHREGSSSEDDC